MIISTWNVNSIKVRLPNVLQYLSEYQPDVLMLQETKSQDENFPFQEIENLGYTSTFCGQKTYNGVAAITKKSPTSFQLNPVHIDDKEMRSILINYCGICILNVYVVNGKDVTSDKYEYKLNWMNKLKSFTKSLFEYSDNLIVLGDFNIAPTDNDVFDAQLTKNQILCSDKERDAYYSILNLGLYDLYQDYDFPPQTFTWWDYRGGAFHKNIGYRIDLILGSKSIQKRCIEYKIDKDTRHKSWCKDEPRTSDHVPVRVVLEK